MNNRPRQGNFPSPENNAYSISEGWRRNQRKGYGYKQEV